MKTMSMIKNGLRFIDILAQLPNFAMKKISWPENTAKLSTFTIWPNEEIPEE